MRLLCIYLLVKLNMYYRLTTDVQEFKSSFKQCISQGLRSVTQIIGCVMSLFMISPQMTGVVSVCLPAMIATGSVMGVVLRRWSREAQEQVKLLGRYEGNMSSMTGREGYCLC